MNDYNVGNTSIKNIIFDFGGVLYDVRYENVGEALKRYGVEHAEKFYGKTFQTTEMDLFEEGLMSPKDFRMYLMSVCNQKLSDSAIDEIINSMLVGMPRERVDLLLSLRSQYKLFLYSNTNQIHYKAFYKQLLGRFGFDVFEQCFDKCYFSHIIHCRKPRLDGFMQIVAEQGILPQETLFIDDNIDNVTAAMATGLNAYHHSSGDVAELFGSDLLFAKSFTCRP